MLWNASVINGCAIAANDGRLGTVSDFLFDDASWLVRWLVVETGKWLSGRKVLLPPSVLGHLDPKGHEFSVELTMQQVKDSPDIDIDRPVSRQMEANIYDHDGWTPYWGKSIFTESYGYVGGAMTASAVLSWNPGGARRILPKLSEATAIRISAASKRSPDTISMLATARSVTSRTSSWRMPIGASVTLSSIRRTGGPGRRS